MTTFGAAATNISHRSLKKEFPFKYHSFGYWQQLSLNSDVIHAIYKLSQS